MLPLQSTMTGVFLVVCLYSRDRSDLPLKSYLAKGEAEVTNYDYSSHTDLEAWSDADLSQDILSRTSITSSEYTYNDVSVGWQCTKQSEPGTSAN